MGYIIDLHPAIRQIGYNFIGNVVYAGKVAVPIILIFLLAYSYGRSMFFQEGVKIDYRPVIRGIVLMFVIAFYPEITNALSSGVSGIINLIPRKPDITDAISQMAEATMSSSSDPDPNDGWFDEIVINLEEALSFTNLVSYALREGLLYMVRAGVSLIRSMVLVFLYLTGPIAFVLSMIPGFKNSGLAWIKGFVGVQFWEMTLRLLDNMVFQYNLYASANYDLSDTGYVIGFNLVALIMYLLTPTLTNYFVNTGVAGGFMSRVAQVGAGMIFMGRGMVQNLRQKVTSQAVRNAGQKANQAIPNPKAPTNGKVN
ncbi:MAG: hypothetical protein AAFN10_08540 [Bacteroidota bacterium]